MKVDIFDTKEFGEFADQRDFLYDESKKLVISFIKYLCRRYKLRDAEVAKYVSESAMTVYNLRRYGLSKVPTSVKNTVKFRDGNKCKSCGARGVQLHVHHLKSPSNHRPSNLQTLCPKCHKEAHKKLSKKGNDAKKAKKS